MIFGIGCDIVDINRIAASINEFGDRFLNRVFTEEEIKRAPDEKHNYYSYFAKRFAAKESFAKAMKTGVGHGLSFKDIEILNDENGMPYFNLPEYKTHLSISDEHPYAIAYVVIEK